MSILLDSIQPCEKNLKKETVEYFLEHPEHIFTREDSIRIIKCEGQPFECYVLNGNNRLFVCYKLNMIKVPIEYDTFHFPPHIEKLHTNIALEFYKYLRIRHWRDLESRIIPTEEYDSLDD